MNDALLPLLFFFLTMLSSLNVIPFTPREILGLRDMISIVNPTPVPVSDTVLDTVQVLVKRVVDGDTIRVKINGQEKTVRLIGIDSPETVDPRKQVQCFGKEASNHAKEMLTGKTIYLQADPTQGDTDKYKRLLRYVFLQDKTNFNETMIREGFAYEYTYDTPYIYQKEFKQAQKEAEAAKRGLWADNVCGGS